MLISEVICLAADLLGIPVGEANWKDPSGDAKTLLDCYRVVENEIALDYFPLRKTETLSVKKGMISYSAFSEAPVDIVRVIEEGTGAALRFRVLPDGVSLPQSCAAAEIEYTYSPEKGKATDSTPFPEKISARLLAYGTANEFCLLAHRYEEAEVWGLRYRDALRAAGILRRTLSVRSRRWI